MISRRCRSCGVPARLRQVLAAALPPDGRLAGVTESWIVDPGRGAALVLQRAGDTFREQTETETYATPLLAGFVLDVAALLAAGSR